MVSSWLTWVSATQRTKITSPWCISKGTVCPWGICLSSGNLMLGEAPFGRHVHGHVLKFLLLCLLLCLHPFPLSHLQFVSGPEEERIPNWIQMPMLGRGESKLEEWGSEGVSDLEGWGPLAVGPLGVGGGRGRGCFLFCRKQSFDGCRPDGQAALGALSLRGQYFLSSSLAPWGRPVCLSSLGTRQATAGKPEADFI